MNPLVELYQFMDDTLHAALSQPENKACCSKGCFHCCREPAYATRSQVRYILENFEGVARVNLTMKVEAWISKFHAKLFENDPKPNAFKYRAAFIWCPLLALDGTCSVYDRRPVECRLFFAQGDPHMCADDSLRPKQKFMDAPGIVQLVLRRSIMQMSEGVWEDYDHIGVLLAEELLGREFKTAARCSIRRTADDFEMMQWRPAPLDDQNTVDKPSSTP